MFHQTFSQAVLLLTTYLGQGHAYSMFLCVSVCACACSSSSSMESTRATDSLPGSASQPYASVWGIAHQCLGEGKTNRGGTPACCPQTWCYMPGLKHHSWLQPETWAVMWCNVVLVLFLFFKGQVSSPCTLGRKHDNENIWAISNAHVSSKEMRYTG